MNRNGSVRHRQVDPGAVIAWTLVLIVSAVWVVGLVWVVRAAIGALL